MNHAEQITTRDFSTTYGEPVGFREINTYIGEGLKSTGPNLNVINILRVFIEDEESVLFIPADYERGSRKRVDEKVHHGHRYAPVAMKVDDFVSSIDRFNFSVRGLKDVHVENESGQLEPRQVFRTYNIIRDGELFIKKVEAQLSQSAFELLTAAGVVFDQVGRKVETEYDRIPDYIYTIDLTGLPLVSNQWAKPNHIKLYDLLELDVFLTQRNKELNKLEKEYKAKLAPETVSSDDKVYIESTKYSKEEADGYYEANCVEYRIKAKKPKFDEAQLREQFPNYESVSKQLSFDKKYRAYLRFIYRAVILAIELSKKQGSYEWSEEKPLPRSDKKTFKEATVTNSQGENVVLQRITWTEQVPV
ncbi:hypothetical protein SP15_285 [Bacillus phage SP-15]|uniref:Uncharacterized protein n=1 Tax=Bacillus phage SP-15 TaxID=1792032 RepID=A0A127AX08_9CAUD|nr:hypothetical protein SP15_285 [Bacillus phage SP-15]AMM45093.1 hypothetical protein SP15_285 [Bacillus phage SP-15]